MMKKNYLFYMICALFVNLSILNAATFHAILVGDTKDEVLHEVVQQDLKRMEAHMEAIFQSLDIDNLRQVTYTGKDTNSEILDDLAHLKVKSDDIVFFYFSGHGFYVEDVNETQWPFLYLSKEDAAIDQHYIMQTLLNHQPRLLICFADCCNNVLKGEEIPDTLYKKARLGRQKKELNSENLKKLFLDKQGAILISSASPGYYAKGTDDDGSCFTRHFIKIFESKVNSDQEVSWESICAKVQEKLWKEQKPQYQLLLN